MYKLFSLYKPNSIFKTKDAFCDKRFLKDVVLYKKKAE